MFLRRLGEDGVTDTQEVMDRLTVPRQEGIIKKEGNQIVYNYFDSLTYIFPIASKLNIIKLLLSWISYYYEYNVSFVVRVDVIISTK